MARIGFKKTYPAGTFNNASVQDLFTHMKSYVIDAGFNVLLNTPTAVDFIRSGSPAGTADDDIPHWAFEFAEQGQFVEIRAFPVHGNDYLDANAHHPSFSVIHTAWLSYPMPEITFWFAVDSAQGWWWLHGMRVDQGGVTGVDMFFSCAGTTSRRYPSDTHQGLCARYGVWDAWGDWYPAYAKDETGLINTNPWTGTWSPFGEGWTNNGKRHAGSPIPRMAVPQFPNRDGGITSCVLGEFNEILILTDGYAAEEMVVPGWVAMVGDQQDQPYAVPAPQSFTVL